MLLSLALAKSKRNYENYAVVRFHANCTDQQDIIKDFVEGNPSNVHIGKEGINVIDLIVSPDFLEKTLDLAKNVWYMHCKILELDLQRAIDAENLHFRSTQIPGKQIGNVQLYFTSLQFCTLGRHTIRKVKFLFKNGILTKLYNFLGKSKLSTTKTCKSPTFSRVFHQKFF